MQASGVGDVVNEIGQVLPDNVSLVTLLPYSLKLNPVENVWQYLRANWLAISIFDEYDAIVAAMCGTASPPSRVVITLITSRQWAEVNA